MAGKISGLRQRPLEAGEVCRPNGRRLRQPVRMTLLKIRGAEIEAAETDHLASNIRSATLEAVNAFEGADQAELLGDREFCIEAIANFGATIAQ
ncbi:MAG: hypothetical protein H3C55_16270 [Pseudorhodoplanes sp.]|nr:hypothetical protein [Pseudorhodoplanes sp.]